MISRKTFYTMLTVTLFTFAVFSLGGCGGSSSSDNNVTASMNTVFVGTQGGTLFETLKSKISFDTFDSAENVDIAGSINEGGMVIFGLDYCKDMTEDEKSLLQELYEKNVTIVLLDADKTQINAMRNALGLHEIDETVSLEEWKSFLSLSSSDLTISGDVSNTEALYSVAKRTDDFIYSIPNDSAIASNKGERHKNYDYVLTSPDKTMSQEEAIKILEETFAELAKELNAALGDLWKKIMTDYKFTKGTAATITEIEGKETATITYDGNNTIHAVGTLENGKPAEMTLTKISDDKFSFDVSQSLVEEALKEPDKTYSDEEAKKLYHESQVENFLEWHKNLDTMSESMAAEKSEIRASAEEVNLADFKGESFTCDLSPVEYVTKFLMNDTSNGYKVARATILKRRKNNVTINVYPVHNFSDGSDWYILKLGGTLNPQNQYFHEQRTGGTDYVFGHTGYYALAACIDNSESGITMIDHSPKNVNYKETKTVGLTLNLNGKIGLSDKGASGEIGGGISKTKTRSFTVEDYQNIDESVGSFLRVKYNFKMPEYDGNNGIAGDGLEDAVISSRTAFVPDVQGVWRIDKSYWQKNGFQRNMTVGLEWSDAIARGNINLCWATIYSQSQVDYPETVTPFKFTPKPPMHLALSKTTIDVNNELQTAEFTLLSEGNWSAKLDSSLSQWCSISESSGSATGDQEEHLSLTISPNNTGKYRSGKITFTLNSGGLKEEHVLKINQYATTKVK
ncbi:MAG: leukocidin family pore-forming toxin [Synergistaceae bacterium]|nr:leukocidin family pore-forming toxin [Synergistaceae bacterium]